MTKTVFRTCTLCEAMCGLRFEVDGERILSVAPDDDDVFSHGFICPKGASIAGIQDDPDRLHQPMRRTADGNFEPISWADAFDLVGQRLNAIRKQHGADAIGLYMGNPIAHNHAVLALRHGLFRAIGTRNCTSAGSQDTSPRGLQRRIISTAIRWRFQCLIWSGPITLLCVGANPRISNGSLLTAPNIRERFQSLRQRGGRLIVVDPRRTETAREADEHVAILPGGDAAFLLSMVQVIVSEGLVRREAIQRLANGFAPIEQRLAAFAPEQVAAHTGVEAETIRRLAREFAQAKTAAAYSRVGVCNNEYGTLASYATDLLNLVAAVWAKSAERCFRLRSSTPDRSSSSPTPTDTIAGAVVCADCQKLSAIYRRRFWPKRSKRPVPVKFARC